MIMRKAIEHDKLEVVQLPANQFPEIVNDMYCTPLPLAVRLRKMETIRFLLSAGADPNFGRHLDHTPLYEARDLETVQLLLDNGARPLRAYENQRDPSLLGMLRHFSHEKGAAMTELLMKHIDVEEAMISTNPADRKILMTVAAERGFRYRATNP